MTKQQPLRPTLASTSFLDLRQTAALLKPPDQDVSIEEGKTFGLKFSCRDFNHMTS